MSSIPLTEMTLEHPRISKAFELEMCIHGVDVEVSAIADLRKDGVSLTDEDVRDLRDIRDRISKLIGDAR